MAAAGRQQPSHPGHEAAGQATAFCWYESGRAAGVGWGGGGVTHLNVDRSAEGFQGAFRGAVVGHLVLSRRPLVELGLRAGVQACVQCLVSPLAGAQLDCRSPSTGGMRSRQAGQTVGAAGRRTGAICRSCY